MSDGDTANQLPPPRLERSHALFLDFDGTLVEIAARPEMVRVPPDLHHLLDELASMLAGAMAIVSGRSVDDLARLLAPFPGTLIGQHGLERRRADGRTVRWSETPALARIRETLTEFAAQHDGIALEDKGATLALHYRQAPQLATACRDIARRASDLVGGVFEAVDGKMVVELVPEGSGKGGAIAVLLTELPFAGRVPIFVGDDSVDEEGFAVIDRMGGISIHVGEGTTSARYGVGSVDELRAWLTRGLAG
jgi:trehalose 6-phosphate phosphatase